MISKKATILHEIRLLVGPDIEWEQQFDNDTKEGVRKIEEDYAKRNLFGSGMCKRDVGFYETKRKQEKIDKRRNRMLNRLSLLPPWITLTLFAISLVISIIALMK